MSSSSSAAIARLQAVMANIAAASPPRGSYAGGVGGGGVPAAPAAVSENSSASASTTSSAPTNDTQTQVTTQPIAVAEDAIRDGGNAIDTFSSYVPTALPHCVLKALFDAHHSTKNSTQQNDIIEILDDSDEECEQEAGASSSLSAADYLYATIHKQFSHSISYFSCL